MAEPARVGIGTDLHRLEPGRPCRLGGVELDAPVGPAGHSDGDAILHAITDALLGAAGLGDLGSLFPDSAASNAGRASGDFLAEALRLLARQGLAPHSVDCAVHCDRPRLAGARDRIRERLASLLDLPVDRVNLKGKSLEGTGGAIETISVFAIALVGPAGALRTGGGLGTGGD